MSEALVPYGWNDHWEQAFARAEGAGGEPARVIRHDGVAVMVAAADGVRQVSIRRRTMPVVGDWAVLHNDVVEELLPRTSLLRRRDPRADIEQMLAANIDVVLVALALDRDMGDNIIQRAVSLGWDSGATPVLLLTKVDVVDDPAAVVRDMKERHPGVEVLAISSVEDHGLDEVRAIIDGKTAVLLGESGAGKSSLTNALLGEELIATAEVSDRNALGRHTTTSRQLHLLPSGGVLIDSPGIRSFALYEDNEAVENTFADIEEIAEHCRFNNCGHTNEPGCAVREAVDDGELDAERVQGWLDMQREVDDAAERALKFQRRR